MNKELLKQAQAAQEAAKALRTCSTRQKDQALHNMAKALRTRQGEILTANKLDLEQGKKRGLSRALLDRLALTEARIEGIAKGLEDLAALPDPVEGFSDVEAAQDLRWALCSAPWVVAMIYEARPNVTVN